MSQLDLFPPPPPLSRIEAVELLRPYLGSDLRMIADQLKITEVGQAVKNSGWAGHTVEWLLGSSPNNLQGADFGTWELKVTTVSSRVKNDKAQHIVRDELSSDHALWRARAPLTITQFQPQDILDTPFADSHLLDKTRRLLLACRLYSDPAESSSEMVILVEYDLIDRALEEVESEYEALRWALRERGFAGTSHIQAKRLGIQASASTRGGGRLIAKKAWVEEMIDIGLRHMIRDSV